MADACIPVLELMGTPALFASEAMRALRERVERIARTPATVLISGESGTGKELVARALHYYSLRGSKPWVDVSCAALPEHLMESELFGYEKGAFSGAVTGKPGLFELAHTGTLFLDEIGELEPKMQVKLLRVLDGAPYYRLGGTRKVSVDVRVVAATNQDLPSAVAAGRFRADLYHRLSQLHLTVPPLRDRCDDIVPLARFFLSQHDANLYLTPDAEEALRRHPWPGNVRELRNAVLAAAVFANRGRVSAEDLAPQLRAAPVVEPPSSRPATAEELQECGDLHDLERRTILRVLDQTGWHQQRAASVLGISRRTLSRKLKTYGSRPGQARHHIQAN